MLSDGQSEFAALFEASQAEGLPERGDLLLGTVLAVGVQGMIVDLARKRDGVVPRADLDQLEAEGFTFKPGDKVAVLVVTPHDKDGNLVVSVHEARQNLDWVTAQELLTSSEVWVGTVSGYNRGGLIVPFGELRAFVPASHVSDLPKGIAEGERQSRMAQLVGREFGFKVIEVDRRRRRLVLSQRDAQKEWREQKRSRLLEGLAEGQIRKGVVSGLRDFGAFVDLGGADGLIHISELSWQRVGHPREVLHVGQEIEVLIIKLDPGGKRIGLSLKRLQPDPWSDAVTRFAPGQVVAGKVARLASFGAFVDLGQSIEGLVHTTQIPSSAALQEGQSVRVRVLSVEPKRQRVALSLKNVELVPPSPAEAEEEDEDGDEDEGR